ncbi:MAG: dihydrolipoyl dehydrogenase [Nitrospirae bacterium]|nr:dihydrolipoyl dehydrogenase [Candidatus Manganitrophaceae bacterium]
MRNMDTFDVMVIGAGSAGRYGARAAAEHGAKVGLIETGPFGGLCILKGCMPTKAYLRSAELVGLIQRGPTLGVYTEGKIRIDFAHIKKRKDGLIAEMAHYAKMGIDGEKNITLLTGSARFLSPEKIQVGTRIYTCKKYLIATGSKETIPPLPGLAETGFITSDDALSMEELPASLILLGGGVEALEFGQFFHRMGVNTTIIQRSAHLLSAEDCDVGECLGEIFRKDGIALYTGTAIKQIKMKNGLKSVSFEHEGKNILVSASEILVVTGRAGNVAELGLDAAGVTTNKAGIPVNEYLQTSNKNIYAAGDVTGINLVVNVATHQGRVAGSNVMQGPHEKSNYRVIPVAVFTDPQFAKVGLSEKEAKAQGIAVQVGKYPFDDLGKAIVTDQTEGFIKILADVKSGEILGVQIVGAEASNLIHQAAIAMHYHATLQDYASIAHIHPTLAEIMLYLVDDMLGID